MLALLILLLGLAAPLVSANSGVTIANQCGYSVYLHVIGGGIDPLQEVAAHTQLRHQMRRDDKTGGITLAVTKNPDGIFSGSPQLDMAYTIETTAVWYDLSVVNGSPFTGNWVAVDADACPDIEWPNGEPVGETTKRCEPYAELQLELCGKL